MKLIFVILLIFMFSCTTQPGLVINTPSPTPGPTSIPDNTNSEFMRVWSAISGVNIADSRNKNEAKVFILKGTNDVYNSIAVFIDRNKNGSDNTFSSSNPPVVSVDNQGNIKALNEGTAQITVMSNLDPRISVKIDINVSTPGNPAPGQTGGTGQMDRATFSGSVYDFHGKKVDRAMLSARSIDGKNFWKGEDQVTDNGFYVFRNAPVGAIIKITASKEGWITKTRYILTKSNLQGDPSLNSNVDFGGTDNQVYALQDEPQITSVKVNGQDIEFSGLFDPVFDLNNSLEFASSAKIIVNQDKFQIKLDFSEPIDRNSLQNSLKINSQKLMDSHGNIFINDETGNLIYNWETDDRSVTVEIDHKLEMGSGNYFANYLVSFSGEGFKDKSGKFANRGKFINFNNGPDNDFFIFRVTNPK